MKCKTAVNRLIFLLPYVCLFSFLTFVLLQSLILWTPTSLSRSNILLEFSHSSFMSLTLITIGLVQELDIFAIVCIVVVSFVFFIFLLFFSSFDSSISGLCAFTIYLFVLEMLESLLCNSAFFIYKFSSAKQINCHCIRSRIHAQIHCTMKRIHIRLCANDVRKKYNNRNKIKFIASTIYKPRNLASMQKDPCYNILFFILLLLLFIYSFSPFRFGSHTIHAFGFHRADYYQIETIRRWRRTIIIVEKLCW